MIYIIIYSCVSIFLTICFTTQTWKDSSFLQERWQFKTFIMFFVVVLPTFIFIVISIIGLSDVLGKYVKSLIKKRKEIKLRKEKIKLGIIRINSLDPYGEENWNE